MSVRGEFGRTVGDAINCLQASGIDAARALATRLERARGLAAEDLEAAARGVLDDWETSAREVLGADDSPGNELRDASERMIAISRIILGERGRG